MHQFKENIFAQAWQVSTYLSASYTWHQLNLGWYFLGDPVVVFEFPWELFHLYLKLNPLVCLCAVRLDKSFFSVKMFNFIVIPKSILAVKGIRTLLILNPPSIILDNGLGMFSRQKFQNQLNFPDFYGHFFNVST